MHTFMYVWLDSIAISLFSNPNYSETSKLVYVWLPAWEQSVTYSVRLFKNRCKHARMDFFFFFRSTQNISIDFLAVLFYQKLFVDIFLTYSVRLGCVSCTSYVELRDALSYMICVSCVCCFQLQCHF